MAVLTRIGYVLLLLLLIDARISVACIILSFVDVFFYSFLLFSLTLLLMLKAITMSHDVGGRTYVWRTFIKCKHVKIRKRRH